MRQNPSSLRPFLLPPQTLASFRCCRLLDFGYYVLGSRITLDKLAYDMHAYNFFLATLTDNLILSRLQLLLLWRMERIKHVRKACVVGLDVVLAIFVDSRGLSESDSPNFGMGKDYRGNIGVVKLLGKMRTP